MQVTSDTVRALQAVQVLTDAGFNLPLAAERMKATPDELLALLAAHPETGEVLTRRMDLQFKLQVFKLWSDTQLVFVSALAEAQPAQALRAFSDLTATVGRQLSSPEKDQGDINMGMLILNMLPPELRQATLRVLKDSVS